MSADAWIFGLASIVVLISAYFVVTARKLMHAALWLGAAFFGVSADYLLLNAEFLAAAQVLIYIGAIATMIIFGVMLSDSKQLGSNSGQPFWRQTMRSGRAGLALLTVCGFIAFEAAIHLRHSWPDLPPARLADSTLALGQALFSKYVIPFEVASAVLLVALIGAIVLSADDAPAHSDGEAQR